MQSAIEREKAINLKALKLCKEVTDKLAESVSEGKNCVVLDKVYSDDVIKVAKEILKKDGIQLWQNIKLEIFASVNTRKLKKAKKLLLKNNNQNK